MSSILTGLDFFCQAGHFVCFVLLNRSLNGGFAVTRLSHDGVDSDCLKNEEVCMSMCVRVYVPVHTLYV